MSAPVRSLNSAAGSVLIFADARDASRAAAERIAQALRDAVADRGRAVLGLATGATFVPVYAHLVERFRAGALSFAEAITYNLDEYYPISPLDPNSYHAYMHRHLFSQLDLAANRAHLLDGTVPEPFAAEQAAQFERWIAADGGLDLQLLGLGRNGHIGFNEPAAVPVAEALAWPTRLIELHPTTRAAAAPHFRGADRVPHRALTVGVAPILAARSLLVLAFGAAKSEAVARSLLGPMTAEVPGSLLQTAASRVTWMLDPAAAADLP